MVNPFRKKNIQQPPAQQPKNIPEAPKPVVKAKIRQPTLEIGVGKKGIGKTFTANKITKRYIQGNPEKGIKPRKVIFFDVNNEFEKVKTIPVDYAFGIVDENTGKVINPKTRKPLINWILAFSSPNIPVEARRVIPVKADGNNMSIEELNMALEYIIKYFKGGLLVVEDTSRYVADSVNRDLTGGLATIRHRNCDVIAHFQWKSKALNPKLFGNINYLRIHKTNDNFKRTDERISGCWEILILAETLVAYMNKQLRENATKEQVDNEKNIPIETFYCIVDFDATKIKGAFSINDFKQSIDLFISDKRNKVLDQLMSQVDNNTGFQKYKYPEAYKIKSEELFREYYGN